jgi:dienelactone hydrolase
MTIQPPPFITRAAFCCALFAMGVTPAARAAPLEPIEQSFASTDGTALKAWVFQPTATAGAPRAVVVALHGCGGLYATTGSRRGQLNARHQAMAEMLVAEGHAVVFPDSLTPRGEREICTQKLGERRVTGTHRRADALAALAWVASQPWAQGRPRVLLGWSHGGSAVLAATDASQAAVAQAPVHPDLAVAFYPGCGESRRQPYRPTGPLMLMLGEKDDWTPAAPCVALGQSVGAEVHVYPDSYHDFDNPVGTVRHRADVPNGVNPGQGVHAGANPAARAQAYARLRSRLDELVSASPARRP